ncbi:hypothetical protein L6R53_28345 [Myxococcota bacterium]|nr:hypothetical protein [Myxococcota bacterium]
MELQQAVATFTRRWHHLEKGLGPRGGLVIDFDLAPRTLVALDVPAFDSREQALETLAELQARVAVSAGLKNRAFLVRHLAGSEAYLRALMGERAPFDRYLRDTMGIAPAVHDPAELADRAAALRERARALDIPWGPGGEPALQARFGRADLSTFEQELRSHAAALVAQVRARVPVAPAPEYRIEVVQEDAYWTNWIDGSVEAGVTLKVNTHPRVSYFQSSPLQLAAHEIAGHAVHVGCLRGSPHVDPCTLSLTVHACEAWQMEGLAQAMLHLLTDGDLPPEVAVLEAYRDYTGDVVNQAQLRVEAGEPIDRVCEQTIALCPLTRPLTIRSGLRDRSRDPLHRAYIHVYAPSRKTFLRALDLPRAARDRFLADVLTGLWTPGQVERLLAGEAAEGVRLSPP